MDGAHTNHADGSGRPMAAVAADRRTIGRLGLPIHAAGPLSRAVLEHGWRTMDELAEHVRLLPYARTTNGSGPLAVLTQQRGTCSSKHQLLAAVAQECGHSQVQLTVGIYEMCERNTPGVGVVLLAASLAWVPEAHCYLTVGGERLDFTGLPPGEASPFDSLLAEHAVAPADLPSTKPLLHLQALETWAANTGVPAAVAWAAREDCIAALSFWKQS